MRREGEGVWPACAAQRGGEEGPPHTLEDATRGGACGGAHVWRHVATHWLSAARERGGGGGEGGGGRGGGDNYRNTIFGCS